MFQRAYSIIDVKSFDAAKRVFAGMATTPGIDRGGDIVEPSGVRFKNPLPLLLYHDSRRPVGTVTFSKPTKDGIAFEASIPDISEPGTLQDRVNEAWQSVKAGLLKGVSIGYQILEDGAEFMRDTGGLHLKAIEVHELSLVAIPMNAEATIQSIKSLDAEHLAASGQRVSASSKSAGVSASSRVALMRTERHMKKSFADQIKEWEGTRAAKSARMTELLTKEDGLTMDDAETEEHDGLQKEVEKIDAQLVRLRAAEKREKETAQPVDGQTAGGAGETRGDTKQHRISLVSQKSDPGIGLARMAMCVAMARGSQSDAIAYAKAYYPSDSLIEKAILGMRAKAAVGAGAVVTSHWADDLVPYNILSNDFIEFLRNGNIVDRFGSANPGGGGNYPSLRRVPFNVRVSGFNAGTTGNWVGEGLPAPMSKATSFNTTLTWAKVAALVGLTKEEIRFSNPNAESKVRDDMARAVNERIDIDFIDPSKAAVANVSPASITSAVVATAPTAATAAGLITDLNTMLKLFATNKLDPSDVVLIMSAGQALSISMMTTTLGMPYFPDITMQGGTLRGFPVLVSEHLTSYGSPSTNSIVAVKAGDIYLADDGNVSIDASDQASVEMLDSALQQSGISGTGASLVSAFQSGLLFILAQREITWKLRRSTAVQYISPAAYAP